MKSVGSRVHEVWNMGFLATCVLSNSGLKTLVLKHKVVLLDMVGRAVARQSSGVEYNATMYELYSDYE